MAKERFLSYFPYAPIEAQQVSRRETEIFPAMGPHLLKRQRQRIDGKHTADPFGIYGRDLRFAAAHQRRHGNAQRLGPRAAHNLAHLDGGRLALRRVRRAAGSWRARKAGDKAASPKSGKVPPLRA